MGPGEKITESDRKKWMTCMKQKVNCDDAEACICKRAPGMCSSTAGLGVTYATLLITLMAIMLK